MQRKTIKDQSINQALFKHKPSGGRWFCCVFMLMQTFNLFYFRSEGKQAWSIILVSWRKETFFCNLFKVQPQNNQTRTKWQGHHNSIGQLLWGRNFCGIEQSNRQIAGHMITM